MIAVSDHLRTLSDASGISDEWYNTVIALRNAADLLIDAAEMIAEGGDRQAFGRLPSPERAVECARACLDRVYDGEKVRPVPTLAWEL